MFQPQTAIFPMMSESTRRDSPTAPKRCRIIKLFTPKKPAGLPAVTRNGNIECARVSGLPIAAIELPVLYITSLPRTQRRDAPFCPISRGRDHVANFRFVCPGSDDGPPSIIRSASSGMPPIFAMRAVNVRPAAMRNQRARTLMNNVWKR